MFAPHSQVCVLRLQGCKPSVLCCFLSLATPPRIPPTATLVRDTFSPPGARTALHCTARRCMFRPAREMPGKSAEAGSSVFKTGVGGSRGCGFRRGQRWNYMMRAGLQWVAKTSPVLKDLLPRSRRSKGEWFSASLLQESETPPRVCRLLPASGFPVIWPRPPHCRDSRKFLSSPKCLFFRLTKPGVVLPVRTSS